MHRFSLIVSVVALVVAAPLGAQQLAPSRVPDGHKPPPGMCRIWIDGVPPGQQSAPTDCATAVRNRPSNGRVVWGDDDRKRDQDRKRDADRPARTSDDRDRPRSSDEGERGRAPTSDPRATEGPDRPRETRNQEKPRETEERPRREPRETESPKPRETRETPKRESEEQRPRTTPSRKPKPDESGEKPARSDRGRPDFARRPR